MKEIVLDIIKDGLFPHICLCGKVDTVLCPDCYDSIPHNKKELCPICQKLSENGKTCDICRSKSYLTGVMIFGKHEGVLKEAIWHYKYESIKDFDNPLSNLLIEKYFNFLLKKKFLITNVPSSKERENWRGYNQAKELALKVAEKTGFEYQEAFSKEDIKPQVGLSRKARIKNIQNKIHLLKDDISFKKRVLIIDDVYTSGSTLEECARILRKAGVKEIWGMVLSRD